MSKFQRYLSRLPAKRTLSNVKRVILERLWADDETPFPKPWVSSSELLQLTQQKYFDRRTRELRDQLGCDLESAYINEFAGHGWRLKSDIISPPQDREYLTEAQKSALFASYNFTCATCGTQVQAGVRGLQADHKVPLSKGGGNEIGNWQPLCHNCNVGKRRACAGCELECSECSWAFPEAHGIPTMVSISEESLRKAEKMAGDNNTSLSQIVDHAIRKL